MTFTVGSLCSGYGGIELGLGFTVEWMADTSESASQIIKERWDVPNLGDVSQIATTPQVDMITAGFPCQPFSQAGKQHGQADERFIIDDIARIWEANGAGWLLLENVAGLLTSNKGKDFAYVNQLFDGHHQSWVQLSASQVGAPHGRSRVFGLVAHTDKDRRQVLPQLDSETLETLIYPQLGYDADGFRVVGDGQSVHERQVGTERHVVGQLETWAEIVGRRCPPVHHRPQFREWLMGLPAGWVTDILWSDRHSIEMLGDGVVPEQAKLGYGLLAMTSDLETAVS